MRTKVSLDIYAKPCLYCKRLMLDPTLNRMPSSFGYTDSLENQMKAQGLVFIGAIVPGTDHDEAACGDCVKAGKLSFTCAICKQTRTSDFLHEDNYAEPECTVCYETMSAKAWEDYHDEQRERNRWYYSS